VDCSYFGTSCQVSAPSPNTLFHDHVAVGDLFLVAGGTLDLNCKMYTWWYNVPGMDRQAFEQLVVDSLNGLPEAFRARLDNVDVVVEDWPDPETMRLAGVHHPAQLLGFYHGVPQTKRTHHYGLVLPDKISIYQQPIEMRCRTMEQVRATVQRVLRHEIAHHFGLGDDRLREIGAY